MLGMACVSDSEMVRDQNILIHFFEPLMLVSRYNQQVIFDNPTNFGVVRNRVRVSN